jgi:glycosyltransferase involved in cell wall biosynthesis
MNNPLVSVITPTANRPELLKRCIEQFLAQDYVNKEMVIVQDLHTDYSNIDFPRINGAIANYRSPLELIGDKRNYACQQANGQIILHMDDDDLYSNNWITRSVAALGENDLTGLSSAYFYNGTELREFVYAGKQPYVCGATMCYWKKTWERKPFKALSEGEDTLFCSNAGRVVPHDYKDGFCAMIHGNNTASHKQFNKLYKRDIGLLPKFDYI